MAKQLLMTPKAIRDRKRLEAKKNGTYQPRQLSQSKDNVRKRAKYMERKFGSVVNTEPIKTPDLLAEPKKFIMELSESHLGKLSRKELKKIIRENVKSIPIPLKIREPGDPNMTQILHTDLAKLISDSQSLKDANKQVEELTKFKIDLLKEREDTEAQNEALKAQQSTDMATIQSKNQEIATLKSEIQTARRQRDDANAHSGIVTKKLEEANAFIEKMNESQKSIDKKISELDIGMGKLNQIATRWKFAFLSVLFVVAVPAIATASAAVYLLTNR